MSLSLRAVLTVRVVGSLEVECLLRCCLVGFGFVASPPVACGCCVPPGVLGRRVVVVVIVAVAAVVIVSSAVVWVALVAVVVNCFLP